MELCALASHSSGNSFFVKANGSEFLVDAGISCRQIVKRLSSIGRDIRDIRGLLITHEHTDHIRGADSLVRKYNIPMYVTEKTFYAFRHHMKSASNVNFIIRDKKFSIDNVEILPFSKSHDCVDPVSYSISHAGKTASVITDVGYACDNVRKAVAGSDILCLEANHDLDMLYNGRYPFYLKQRIGSEVGHLSNYDATVLTMDCATPRLKTVMLSHLSEVNNTPEIARLTFDMIKDRKDLNICCAVASRESPSEVFRV